MKSRRLDVGEHVQDTLPCFPGTSSGCQRLPSANDRTAAAIVDSDLRDLPGVQAVAGGAEKRHAVRCRVVIPARRVRRVAWDRLVVLIDADLARIFGRLHELEGARDA